MATNGSSDVPNFQTSFQPNGSLQIIGDQIRAPRKISDPFRRRHSNYRGVTRSGDGKKWEARLGKLAKDAKTIYIGRFKTEKEAAEAYDTCVIRLKGRNAITNFPLEQYNVRSIVHSEKFPIGDGASRVVKTETVDYIVNKSMSDTTPSSTPVTESPNRSPSISALINPNFSSAIEEDLMPRSEPVPVQESFLGINESCAELDWDHDLSAEKFGVWDSDQDLCIHI